MANNRIQIKRSATTATPTSLLPGELAFSNVTGGSGVLFIGDTSNSAVVAIGGVRNPGTLTANQALVANSTSGINQVQLGNLVFVNNTQTISANGSTGTAGWVLFSGGPSSNIYWASSGSLTTNVDAQYVWTNTHTFQNTITFSSLANAAAINVTGQINTATIFVTTSANIASSNVIANTAGVFVANATGVVNAAVHSVGTSFTANSTLVNAAAINITGQVNTATLFVTTSANIASSNVIANTAGVFIANSTGIVNAAVHQVGANLVINSTAFNFVGNTTTSPTISLANTGALTIGTGTTTQTTSKIDVANSVGNVVITPGTISINATGSVNASSYRVAANIIANTTQLTLTGVQLSANGGVGSQGQALFSNGSTGSPYWAAVGDITSVTAGNGLTGGGTSGDVTLDVGAGNGISVSADAVTAVGANGITVTSAGINVLGNTGVTVNSTGVFIGQPVATTSSVTFADLTVNGNTKLGDATSDVVTFTARVNTSIIPDANQAYDLGSNLLRWNNVYGNTLTISKTATFGANVSIDGTLTVTGNLVTQNVQSVIVSDPMIYLAGNNYTSDLLDIGFAGNYNDGVTNRHAGLFRDHDDGIWKLFTNLTQELSGNNDVDVLDASYRIATLQAYLNSGGLTTNSSSANITANSTFFVNMTANVITLSGRANNDLLFTNSTGQITGLALNTTGGYVLQTNGTAIVYDYLDGGTF